MTETPQGPTPQQPESPEAPQKQSPTQPPQAEQPPQTGEGSDAGMLKKMTMGDIFIAGGGFLMFLGPILPWVSVSLGPFGGGSVNGFHSTPGIFVFLIGLAAMGLTVARMLTSGKERVLGMATLAGSALAVLLCIIDMIRASDSGPMGASTGPGVGLFFALIGALAAGFGALGIVLDKPWTQFLQRKLTS